MSNTFILALNAISYLFVLRCQKIKIKIQTWVKQHTQFEFDTLGVLYLGYG